MKRIPGLGLFIGSMIAVVSLAGCASRSSTAYIEIENDQAGMGKRAEPVIVDPGVEVLENEYRRSSVNDGSNILQKIHIRGPIMIVPAPTTSQPTK